MNVEFTTLLELAEKRIFAMKNARNKVFTFIQGVKYLILSNMIL
ncbi:hypothetical protein TZ05_2025c [Listeria monocytogenes]|nr:hypothetical protein TZ05_2025c [Listeria monocytogenes]CUK56375.1 hypothetical protein LM600444_60287 [Listeria monocytogenes]CUK62336.1 hypothetical protein LM600918_180013 [Listeria monocytogenes]CUK98057.1 hypothetical protein LM701042_60287 [Listeria monocytogenes]